MAWNGMEWFNSFLSPVRLRFGFGSVRLRFVFGSFSVRFVLVCECDVSCYNVKLTFKTHQS